jgi:predicted nucleic acid-binding Zn ribbon protein
MTRRPKGIPVTAELVLRDVVSRLGLKSGLSRHRVVHLWPRIVEPTVARHARAERVVGGTLHVIVDSSVWMFELATIKDLLLEKVNAFLDAGAAKITDIRFSQRSWGTQKPKEAPAPPSPQLGPQDLRIVGQILEPIQDDTLKALLQRILEKDRLMKQRRQSKT